MRRSLTAKSNAIARPTAGRQRLLPTKAWLVPAKQPQSTRPKLPAVPGARARALDWVASTARKAPAPRVMAEPAVLSMLPAAGAAERPRRVAEPQSQERMVAEPPPRERVAEPPPRERMVAERPPRERVAGPPRASEAAAPLRASPDHRPGPDPSRPDRLAKTPSESEGAPLGQQRRGESAAAPQTPAPSAPRPPLRPWQMPRRGDRSNPRANRPSQPALPAARTVEG